MVNDLSCTTPATSFLLQYQLSPLLQHQLSSPISISALAFVPLSQQELPSAQAWTALHSWYEHHRSRATDGVQPLQPSRWQMRRRTPSTARKLPRYIMIHRNIENTSSLLSTAPCIKDAVRNVIHSDPTQDPNESPDLGTVCWSHSDKVNGASAPLQLVYIRDLKSCAMVQYDMLRAVSHYAVKTTSCL